LRGEWAMPGRTYVTMNTCGGASSMTCRLLKAGSIDIHQVLNRSYRPSAAVRYGNVRGPFECSRCRGTMCFMIELRPACATKTSSLNALNVLPARGHGHDIHKSLSGSSMTLGGGTGGTFSNPRLVRKANSAELQSPCQYFRFHRSKTSHLHGPVVHAPSENSSSACCPRTEWIIDL